MAEWRAKLPATSDVSTVSATTKACHVLTELRNMNNNYVEFFKSLMGGIEQLQKDGAATQKTVEEIKKTVNDKHGEFDKKIAAMEERLKVLEERDQERGEKLLEMECRQRKRNLIIPNLPEKPRQTRNQNRQNNEETYAEIHLKVVKFLEEKLGILNAKDMLFRNIHRLGPRNPAHTRPRNVIVAFIQQPDVDAVLQAARELANPNVTVRTDLPKQYNDLRNGLLAIRKNYRERPDGQRVQCKLVYIKFKPTLFKRIGDDDVKVEVELGPDNKYREVVDEVDITGDAEHE